MLRALDERPANGCHRNPCDLILHSRGTLQPDNLIAIEMKKKHHKKADKDADRDRLVALTMQNDVYPIEHIPEHVSGYELGLFIELDVAEARYLTEVYRGGGKGSELTVLNPSYGT
jgi:hypothetical protein